MQQQDPLSLPTSAFPPLGGNSAVFGLAAERLWKRSADSEEVGREDSAPKSMSLRMPRLLFWSKAVSGWPISGVGEAEGSCCIVTLTYRMVRWGAASPPC